MRCVLNQETLTSFLTIYIKIGDTPHLHSWDTCAAGACAIYCIERTRLLYICANSNLALHQVIVLTF
jgi:hypothetical protein